MKYASEVINLLAAYPGREFRMAQIVRYIDPSARGRDRQRIRNGALRVLDALQESGTVLVEPQPNRGMSATYRWVPQVGGGLGSPKGSGKLSGQEKLEC